MSHCIVIGRGSTLHEECEYVIVLGDAISPVGPMKFRLIIGSMVDIPISEKQYWEIRAALSGPINVATI